MMSMILFVFVNTIRVSLYHKIIRYSSAHIRIPFIAVQRVFKIFILFYCILFLIYFTLTVKIEYNLVYLYITIVKQK